MGAGLVIPDFPRAFGHWLLPWAHLPYNPNAPFPVTPAMFQLQVLVHYGHRVVALLVALLGIGLASYHRLLRSPSRLFRLAVWLLGLTAAQVSLGAAILWTQKSVPVTIAHVTTGALLLGSSVILALWSWRLCPAAPAPALGVRAATGLPPAPAGMEV